MKISSSGSCNWKKSAGRDREEDRDDRECPVTIRIHIYKTLVVFAERIYIDILESDIRRVYADIEKSFVNLKQLFVSRRKRNEKRRAGRGRELCAVQTCG